MGWYASGITRPVHAVTCRRLAPAIRRTSSTVSGSTPAPTTTIVPASASRIMVMNRYVPKVMAAASPR